MKPDEYKKLAEQLLSVVLAAGRVEMEIYRQEFQVDYKQDDSPVTVADRAAEAIILKALGEIAPDIPVLAEEAASEGHIPLTGERFFLVDPLDGTKEFIRKSKEFTVNIALIEQGRPVFGLVYAPALCQLYVTLGPKEAMSGFIEPDSLAVHLDELALKGLTTIPAKVGGVSVVVSKSHMTAETRAYLEQFKVREFKSAGSSLKFCLLAAGEADLYPRFGPTMEWDTSAGHAILLAAGGHVLTERGEPLTYGKVEDNYQNPSFIAWGHRQQNNE